MSGKPLCSIDGCGKEANRSRGWCHMHYMRWIRSGDPNTTYKNKKPLPSIGTKFGKLEVIDGKEYRLQSGNQTVAGCLCKCECGIEKIVRVTELRGGTVKSCGNHKSSSSSMALKEAKVRSRKRPAHITTALVVWRGNYKDGCSFEKFFELSQQDCFYCGAPPNNVSNAYAAPSRIKANNYDPEWIKEAYFVYNGLDRVDPSKEHLEDNVVPCCKTCNIAKHNMTVEEFYSWIERVYKHTKTQK